MVKLRKQIRIINQNTQTDWSDHWALTNTLPSLELPAEMRFASKNSLWSLAVCLTAVLYVLEMEPRETSRQASYRINTQQSVLLTLPARTYVFSYRLWEAAVDLRNINVWFSWASYVNELDKTPMAVGKRFRVGYRLPGAGDYTFIATLKEYRRGRWGTERYNHSNIKGCVPV